MLENFLLERVYLNETTDVFLNGDCSALVVLEHVEPGRF